MPYYPKGQYTFVKFEKSHLATKKYDAILKGPSGREVRVPFGAIGYDQYKDQTSLKLYSDQDHGDMKRRASYIARHKKDTNKAYSPSWFSLHYLW